MMPHKKYNQGMTFIEVLVAFLILMTGILGAVAMEATVKKSSFDAMQRSLASSLAQDLIERMRSNNADALVLDDYIGTYGAAALSVPANRCNSVNSLCTPSELAINDLFEWTQLLRGAEVLSGGENAGGLVNALACVATAGQVVTIVITWQGRTETQDAGSGECGVSADKQRRQFELTAFLF